MISTFDSKLILEIFIDLKSQYPDKSVRFQSFLATCLYLDADNNMDFVLKNRPYGGLIGIDNSSLDKHLKQFKFLRILAILHDAAGYLQEKNHTGPGYTYVLPCPIKNCSLVHVTGIAFYLFLKAFKLKLFRLLEC